MLFVTILRYCFGVVLLIKFHGELLNAETLSGQKGHLIISLGVLCALYLQPMLIRELNLLPLQLVRPIHYSFETPSFLVHMHRCFYAHT